MKTIANILEFIKTGNNKELEIIIAKTPSLANEKTEHGISLLQFAAYCRNETAIAILKKHKQELDIFEASSIGETRIVTQHLSKYPELINSFAKDGFTPLGLASFFGQLEIVKLLLSQGADSNIAANNDFKVAPIHSACAISYIEIVTALIQHGANVNATQMKGVTPLHTATHNGQTALVQLLIDKGADVNAKMDDGQTPLSIAREKGFDKTAELLKQHLKN